MQPALIIFIKNPLKGQVKTRLGRVIGDDEALWIYLELCQLTRDAIAEFPGTKYLFYSDEIIIEDEWNSIQFNKQKQLGSDLGQRMEHAFEFAFKTHHKVILIGSDCPYLKLNHLQEAIETLDKHDCVLGPARDGGYYLIGIRTMIPSLFKDKTWSSESVLAETLETLKKRNHTGFLLETLEDIDNISDWERYLNSIKSGSKD